MARARCEGLWWLSKQSFIHDTQQEDDCPSKFILATVPNGLAVVSSGRTEPQWEWISLERRPLLSKLITNGRGRDHMPPGLDAVHERNFELGELRERCLSGSEADAK